MGRAKQLIDLLGLPLVEHTVRTALRACRRVILVQGAVDLGGVVPPREDLRIVENPRYREGQLGSLQRGIAECTGESLFIMLADLPLVKEETYRRLAAEIGDAAAAYPLFHGRRGHPVLVTTPAIERLRAARPGERAMDVIAPLLPRGVSVDDSGIYRDADTPEELVGLASQMDNSGRPGSR